jgi:hypothetical protein
MVESCNSNWVGFFLILAVLGAAAVFIPIFYNLALQLKPDVLEQAQARWRRFGPANYELDYQERHTLNGVIDVTSYRVTVRNRRVTAVVCDGELTYLAGAGPALGLGPWSYLLPGRSGARDVDEMFEHIDAQLQQDLLRSRRPYATADFDPKDGHPRRYVRRISGGSERLEWTARLSEEDGKSDGRLSVK